ncbi:glycosyltransferase family protein [Butyrivibrio sp. VCB2001]|uniref:glycosyltransferase family protein n=1 Tax=Butyrivibrio sp. VCB2001 TaxID=1280667 RepID=UPI0004056DC9|nr:glycosyltransferase [Butyrivibrio sp. VCB2001]
MKLLFLGAFGANYIRNNWLEPLRELYDVVYISVPWLFKEHSREEIEEYIYEVIRRNSIKYIFVYSDGMANKLSDEFYSNIRKSFFVFTFHADDEPETWYQINEPYDHRYDLIFTHSKRGHQRREHRFFNDRNSVYLPWGYNERIYHPVNDTIKDIDVLFIGTNKLTSAGTYYEEGESRRNQIALIYNYCKENNYVFKLFGYKWDRDPLLKECWEGFVDDNEISDVIGRSRIVLNFGMSCEGGYETYQTKIRQFEVGGCNVFQITNENPELREIFGDNIGFFGNSEELMEVLKHHLEHPEEAREKAQKVYDECIKSHTMQHRIKKLISIADNICPCKKQLDSAPKSNIEVIRINKDLSIDSLISAALSQVKDSSKGYCLIADQNTRIFDFNESLISSFLEEKYDVIQTDTFIRFRSFNQTIDSERGLVPDGETVHPRNIAEETLNIGLLQDTYLGFIDQGVWKPLMNYVIAKDKLISVLQQLITNNGLFREELKVINSHMQLLTVDLMTDLEIKDNFSLKIVDLLNAADNGKNVVFYGVGGYMYSRICTAIAHRGKSENIAFIDNGMVGNEVTLGDRGEIKMPIRGARDLEEGQIKADIIAITALFGSDALMRELSAYHPRCLVLPFGNLNHTNWRYLHN